MTPGKPPDGGEPSGMMYAHTSGVLSEAEIVTGCPPLVAAARPANVAAAAHTTPTTTKARTTRTRPTERTLARLYDGRHGSAAGRRLRFRGGRADRPPRVPRDDAERGQIGRASCRERV